MDCKVWIKLDDSPLSRRKYIMFFTAMAAEEGAMYTHVIIKICSSLNPQRKIELTSVGYLA